MKNFLIILSIFALTLTINAQEFTEGTLTVNITTETYGGTYGPRHCAAIWVATENGVWVKTLYRMAAVRKVHLRNYMAANPSDNVTDAITGATLPNHSGANNPKICEWEGTDAHGNLVEDGGYRVYYEQTENHANPNPIVHFLTFNKGTSLQTVSQGEVIAGFSDAMLTWAPILPEPCYQPHNLSGEITENNEVTLLWDAPESTINLSGYNIYENDVKINSELVNELIYNYSPEQSGLLTMKVSALFNNDCAEQFAQDSIELICTLNITKYNNPISIFAHQNTVNIENKSNIGLTKIEVIDLQGKVVFESNVNNSNSFQLKVVEGVYFVNLYDKKGKVATEKVFLKQ